MDECSTTELTLLLEALCSKLCDTICHKSKDHLCCVVTSGCIKRTKITPVLSHFLQNARGGSRGGSRGVPQSFIKREKNVMRVHGNGPRFST